MKRRRCTKCLKKKPETVKFFYWLKIKKTNWQGFSSRCKICIRKAHSEYARNNREKYAENLRRWKKDFPKKFALSHFKSYLKKEYGITVQQYEELVRVQKNKCVICGKKPKGKGLTRSRLIVDHCHRSKKIRGLLCGHCNLILGHAFDNPEILLSAAYYLLEEE